MSESRSARSKRPTVKALQETLQQYEATVELLTERIAELELHLEDAGWRKLTSEGEREFSREALREINRLARLMWLKNPLIQRGVNVQTAYVFGQGINVHARHPKVDAVIQTFLADSKNQAELTGHQARLIKETELQLFGNLFFVFFTNKSTGRVRVRTIPVDEVAEVITNPEDSKDPWYYKRVWTEKRLDEESGETRREKRTAYYPDWRHRPARRPKTIGGHPVQWDTPVYHVKVGALSDMKFGVSEVYSAIDWARAYKEFLEDWATLTRAYSRFAWKLTTKGGSRGVAAAKTKLGTTLAAGSLAPETNPPPTVGSTFIGSEGTNLDPIRIAGANVSAEDGRRLLLMVAAAVGLPETFFGDASVGTLATAKSLDRPTELKMRNRQMFWAGVHADILGYVVEQAVRAPSGPLKGRLVEDDDGTPQIVLEPDPETGAPIDPGVDVDFPPILEHDVAQRVAAIVDAATLKGGQPAGTMDDRTLVRLLLTALGEDDVDELLDRIAPDNGESLIAQLRRERMQLLPGAGDKEGDDEGEEQPATEAMMVEAVRELRTAVRTFLEKYAPAA